MIIWANHCPYRAHHLDVSITEILVKSAHLSNTVGVVVNICSQLISSLCIVLHHACVREIVYEKILIRISFDFSWRCQTCKIYKYHISFQYFWYTYITLFELWPAFFTTSSTRIYISRGCYKTKRPLRIILFTNWYIGHGRCGYWWSSRFLQWFKNNKSFTTNRQIMANTVSSIILYI